MTSYLYVNEADASIAGHNNNNNHNNTERVQQNALERTGGGILIKLWRTKITNLMVCLSRLTIIKKRHK